MFLSISVKNQPILIFFAYNNILRKVCSEQRNITNLYVHLNCKVLPPHYLGKWEKGDFSKIFTYNRLNKRRTVHILPCRICCSYWSITRINALVTLSIAFSIINETHVYVYITNDVVDICLEMFNCVPAEQTVAIRKAKFLKKVSNSSNMLFQTFAAEAEKELATL